MFGYEINVGAVVGITHDPGYEGCFGFVGREIRKRAVFCVILIQTTIVSGAVGESYGVLEEHQPPVGCGSHELSVTVPE